MNVVIYKNRTSNEQILNVPPPFNIGFETTIYFTFLHMYHVEMMKMASNSVDNSLFLNCVLIPNFCGASVEKIEGYRMKKDSHSSAGTRDNLSS